MVKVTIITITFNAEKHLAKTMLSVLNQETADFEYIIIDGKSKDATVDIICEYEQKIKEGHFPNISIENFRWISEPDTGLYDAMNKGLKMASGDFVWFMNAGDKMYDNQTLSAIQQEIHNEPAVDVVYGQSLMIDEDDNPLGERHKIAPKTLSKKDLLKGLVICHQSIIVRKSIAPQYNLKYKISADYDWVNKVLSISKKNIYIDQYLSKFMIAGVSSVHRKKSWQERFEIMNCNFGLFATLWAHFIILVKYPFTRKY